MNMLLSIAACAALAASCDAHAVRGLADVSIIDRDSGLVLSPYVHRGEYWVAGKAGARYAIEIRNRTGERLLAVTSVDGINILSGAAAAWDQTGYVFGAAEDYRIAGWRKSDTEVAAFTFADLPDSYAARTGRPGNVGVIGVALFRERQPAQVPQVAADLAEAASDGASNRARAAESPAAEASRFAAAATASPAAPVAPMAKLGTGHGGREYSHVSHTEFERLQSHPDEIIRIHYDSYANLLAMGIVRRPAAPAPSADPFPGSPDTRYVPDPPGG
jgi:hypothetical protein